MDEHEERSRAAADHDADATQFVMVGHIPDDRPGPRWASLLPAIALGILLALALLAAVAYTHRGRPAPAGAGARP